MTSSDQDRQDERLLAPLRDVASPPPPGYDVAEAIRTGRRRIRRRHVTSLSAVAAATALAVAALPVGMAAFDDTRPTAAPPSGSSEPTPTQVPSGPTPPTSCTIGRLPVDPGAYQSIVTAADPTARYVAARVYHSTSDADVVFYDDRTPHVVDMTGVDGSFTDVNEHGVAVGFSFMDAEATTAWIYRNGTLAELPGANARAVAINERGDVVGHVLESPAVSRPVVWRADVTSSEPEPLPMPDGAVSGQAVDIDTDGTVLATYRTDRSEQADGYLVEPDGTVRLLPDDGYLFSSPDAIRDGWVVGFGALPLTGAVEGFEKVQLRWNLRTGEVRPYDPRFSYDLDAVNAHGWFVGDVWDSPTPFVLATGSGTVPLPGLVPAGGAEDPTTANQNPVVVLTDDGRTVVGTTDDGNGRPQAVTWTCR